MFVIAGYSMMVLVATALVSQLTVSGALAPAPSVMSGPGADIAQCAQAGVCSSDPGLMVTTSGVRDIFRVVSDGKYMFGLWCFSQAHSSWN